MCCFHSAFYLFSIVLNGDCKENNLNISDCIKRCMVVSDVLSTKEKVMLYSIETADTEINAPRPDRGAW